MSPPVRFLACSVAALSWGGCSLLFNSDSNDSGDFGDCQSASSCFDVDPDAGFASCSFGEDEPPVFLQRFDEFNLGTTSFLMSFRVRAPGAESAGVRRGTVVRFLLESTDAVDTTIGISLFPAANETHSMRTDPPGTSIGQLGPSTWTAVSFRFDPVSADEATLTVSPGTSSATYNVADTTLTGFQLGCIESVDGYVNRLDFADLTFSGP